ncbi:malto-oligosyltrehalose synthase [Candidatus Methylomicrobium oryzae]|uniref:malto-oligosyltrehalose synthase n=1 Tax=Candidatus Methylomicrobium oryzae TaxID=2802053 RepID=UPI001F007133|nr:malto-oligosyltrehalose synthase [Methylomicrobium sp. RS1]
MIESTAGYPLPRESEEHTAESALLRQKAAIPVSTYRLQLNKDFTFAKATRLVPYLRRLGISHCYVSPYLKARPGSAHGYDIVDHSEINPEIGSAEAFDRFVAELQRHGMGLIADIVPNHMGVMGSDNLWWQDILENGQASGYADFFDIEWHPVNQALQNKLLIPVLGGLYGEILEQQQLTLEFDATLGEFGIYYFQHRFPIDPQTYPLILNSQHEQLTKAFAPDDPVFPEYQTLDNSFSKLPLRTETTEEKKEERRRDKEVFKKHLARLCADNPPILRFIAYRVAEINRNGGESSEMHALLEKQVYRLAYWRVAGDEINYRRFFDINDLAGLRIEDEKVFDATHQLILSQLGQGKIQGLRIDHADGLYDPVAYYERLNKKMAAILLNIETEPKDMPPVYVVAEKIVANYEYLSSDWPIHGTTGYEFANIVNGVFIDNNAQAQLTRCYGRFARKRQDFGELVYQSKKLVMKTLMGGELNVLANQLSKIANANPKTRDYTLNALREALSEMIACFPVYRTYINSNSIGKKDSQYINWAIEQAKQRSRAADKTVFEFIRNILLLEQHSPVSERERLKFAMKLQQYTAPVMAKGYEDTACYRYNRLISVNEVGGDPGHLGYSVNAFHYFNQERLKKWPHSMLSLSTHDSKHSADMRARINVLSEIPRQWQEAVLRWRKLTKQPKSKAGRNALVWDDEYLFYQVLIGTWPLTPMDDTALKDYRERIRAYMIKAVREAKLYTSWIDPNENYEQAVDAFVCRCLDTNANPMFLREFTEFEKRIRTPGLLNTLAQSVLQLTSPGVPDIYQGSELWQFSLVDPDNRRPLDFDRHHQAMEQLDAMLAEPGQNRLQLLRSLFSVMEDGRIKLFVMMQTLRFRLRHAALFQTGDYLKINIQGNGAERLLAFARKDQNHFVIIVVPRLIAALYIDKSDPPGDFWNDTRLELPPAAPEEYRDLFGQCRAETIRAEDQLQLCLPPSFGLFPFAIMSPSSEPAP